MKVTRKSVLTKIWHTLDLDITPEQLDRYENGGVQVQNVFPNLSIPEREFIKTGITPDEWKAEFGDADREEPQEHDYLL